MAERRSKINSILKSRYFVIILTVCLFIFLIGFAKAFWRDWQIRQEIAQLEQTRQQLEQKKIQILDYLKESEGDSYAEKEARLHFGLVKPGETAVIINDGENVNLDVKLASTTFERTEESKISNIKKWWDYFFK